jgi:hypothetical protein
MLHQSFLAATAIKKNMLRPKKTLAMNHGLTMQALSHHIHIQQLK